AHRLGIHPQWEREQPVDGVPVHVERRDPGGGDGEDVPLSRVEEVPDQCRLAGAGAPRDEEVAPTAQEVQCLPELLRERDRPLRHRVASSSSSFVFTWACEGFVCVEPSANRSVGTVWFPPFAASTTAAPLSMSSMFTSVYPIPAWSSC